MDHVVQPELHVVAQVVEAELVVGAVGDVGGVLRAPLLVAEPVHDAADGEAEELVDLAHPFGVAARQIVVDRDDVHALAGQRIEIGGQGRDQRLAFARLHLGDHAAVEHDPAHELHVEVALAERALGRLAHRGEGLVEDVLEALAGRKAPLEHVRARAQLGVRELLELGLERVDLVGMRLQALYETLVGGAEQLPGDGAEHGAVLEGGQTGAHTARRGPAAQIGGSAVAVNDLGAGSGGCRACGGALARISCAGCRACARRARR